jgi:hypothetical protein
LICHYTPINKWSKVRDGAIFDPVNFWGDDAVAGDTK